MVRVMRRGFALGWLVLVAACGGRTPGTTSDAAAPDATPDAAPDLVGTCPLDVTDTADASGYSPLGSIVAPLAWVGIHGGECGGMHVVLVPHRDILEPHIDDSWGVDVSGADNALVVVPGNWDSSNGGWINTGEMLLRHHVAGETVSATGIISITEFIDWPVPGAPPNQTILTATFAVDASGWSISGWIKAVRCSYLDILCV